MSAGNRVPDILKRILERKAEVVAERSEQVGMQAFRSRLEHAPPPRGFLAALERSVVAGGCGIIAEIKRASPSKGVIRDPFDPAAIARSYERGGATCLSVLTDEDFFQGSDRYLEQARQATALPVLRKDFIIDPYQVYEARAAGADAILLIAECLTEPVMMDLLILATELKLSILLEVHDLESLVQVKQHLKFPKNGYTLLGINNRNLKTMTTSLDHTIDLLKEVPDKSVLVSESGIRTHEDIQRLADHGVHRVLVGEHLMRQPDVGEALRALTGN